MIRINVKFSLTFKSQKELIQ